MTRPRPYYVSFEDTTPEEHGPGWFWVQEEPLLFVDDKDRDVIHGPFPTLPRAEEAIDAFLVRLGEPQ